MILEQSVSDKGASREPLCVATHYVLGPRVEIRGPSSRGEERFLVEFIDGVTNRVEYSTQLEVGQWCQANRRYQTSWHLRVSSLETGVIEAEDWYDPREKRVYIAFESKALGDTLAWIGYVEAYRREFGCHVVCSSFWSQLFEDQYPDIEFVEPGTVVEDIYGMFQLGVFTESVSDRHPHDPRVTPLQGIAAEILGVNFREIRPRLAMSPSWTDRPVGPYICIAEHGTAEAKYWKREDGWQDLVNALGRMGVGVVVVSKESTTLENVTDRTGASIWETVDLIRGASCFVGVSSGLSWLAWAARVPVVMVSGFTEAWYECAEDVIRLAPTTGCAGCFNHPDAEFDKSDWSWCPRLKGTPRQFECSRSISAEEVIEAVVSNLEQPMYGTEYLNAG